MHPHPGMGGDSSHPFVVSVARLLEAGGVAVITPDLHDPDVSSAASEVERLAAELDADRLFLVGYSWGSIVVSHAQPARLAARVLVAPPAAMPLGDVATHPVLALCPENDQYGGAVLPTSATVETVPGADHFLWGHVDEIAARAVDWLSQSTP